MNSNSNIILEKQYYDSVRKELIPFLPKSYQRVLEIGCGTSQFRQNLKENCEYWGIEPVDYVSIESNKEDNITILNGLYEEVLDRLPDNYFDLVICNDVVEHMSNHEYFFTTIKRFMTKDAELVGSIPNVRFIDNLKELIFEKDWRYRDQGILDKTHLRFFTEKSLMRLLKEQGYKVECFAGINSMLDTQSKKIKLKALLKFIPFSFIGKDIQYLQFAFRIKQCFVEENQ